MKKWTLLLLLCGSVLSAQTEPATVPATMPSTLPATTTASTAPATAPSTTASVTRESARPDRRFAPPTTAATGVGHLVLTPRAMPKDFAVLSSRSIFVHGRMRMSDGGPTTSLTVAPPARPEQSLVFNGATLTESQIVAFIEDTSAGKVMKLRAGEAVARGKLGTITLDTLEYDAGGKVTRVQIGQNLDGNAAVMPTSRPVSSDASPGSTTGPSGGASDMLEKLRLKRLQELGGK